MINNERIKLQEFIDNNNDNHDIDDIDDERTDNTNNINEKLISNEAYQSLAGTSHLFYYYNFI